jgi:hypothetical protein
MQDNINTHAQSFVINNNKRFAVLQEDDMYLSDVQSGRDLMKLHHLTKAGRESS